MLTILWCCEGPMHHYSDTSTNSRYSVVIHTYRVQLLSQYDMDRVPCCTTLSGLSRVWQVCVGGVSPIVDSTVSRSSEPRQKDAGNRYIVG